MIRTGGRARKSSAGYDLTRLFVGSEGTLGIITEVHAAAVRHRRRRSRRRSAPSTRWTGAVDTVIQLIQFGVPVARVEFARRRADARLQRAIRGSRLPEKPHLFFEFHGSPRGRGRAGRDGGGARRPRTAARNSTGPTGRRTAPGCGRRGTTPISPPRRCGRARGCGPRTSACRSSRLAEAVTATRADVDAARADRADRRPRRRRQLPRPVPARPDAPEERERAEAVYDRMVARAIAVGRHLHRRARHRPDEARAPDRGGGGGRGRRPCGR